MAFTKATRKQAKLRLALTGPSGSGKTHGALLIAKGLGGKIALIDTERGSASLYSDLVDFDCVDLNAPYTPEAYIVLIKEAEKAGYDVLIIDSASHEWNGIGGCLEINEELARAKYKGNSWSAWNETTPRHRKFLDAMMQSKMHIIATSRSKTETAQVDGDNGRKKVVKFGMKAEQRDGFEYEFTVVLDISHEGHYAVASKDRTRLFAGDPEKISEDTGKRLLAWLESGAEPTPDVMTHKDPTFTEQDIDKMRDDAVEIVNFVINNQMESAMEIYDRYPGADEKAKFWSFLDSKTRSTIKRHGEELRKKANVSSNMPEKMMPNEYNITNDLD